MLNNFLFYLALATLLACSGFVLLGFLGNRSIRNLRDVPPLEESPLPSVSIIVAARNEERNIEKALRSLLALDYDDLEFIVVDDRSTDQTPAILQRVAREHAELRVLRVDQLPAGWLGKNHALWCGAEKSRGELILFTDADVVMHPSTLRRAVGYMLEHRIDHLPMLFQVHMPNWWLEVFVLTFSLYFFAWFRPWKAKDPRSRAYVGAGGFNLIRREVYRAIGTYEAIRMRPDDDVKLGKLVKKNGFRQELLIATDHVSVPWYSSLGELIGGLEKNAFAGVDYRVSIVVLSSIVFLTLHVFPFVAVCFTSGLTRWLYLAVIAVLMLGCLNAAHHGKLRLSCSLGFPIGVLLFVAIQWRTMVVNLVNGGIRWRDTLYPLAELKANKV